MQRNVNDWERVVSFAAGAALVWRAVRARRGLAAAALGSGLIARGVTGYCPFNAMMGRRADRSNTKIALAGDRGIHVYERITINRPPGELFRFWRDFASLPRFMTHLQRVEVLSPTRSVWTARGPAGMHVTWVADVINEVQDELIGWQSQEQADVATAGSVRFVPVPGGTEIVVHLQYEPPAGKLGAWVASWFGEEPSQQIREDLRRLKTLLESGEPSRTDTSARLDARA